MAGGALFHDFMEETGPDFHGGWARGTSARKCDLSAARASPSRTLPCNQSQDLRRVHTHNAQSLAPRKQAGWGLRAGGGTGDGILSGGGMLRSLL